MNQRVEKCPITLINTYTNYDYMDMCIFSHSGAHTSTARHTHTASFFSLFVTVGFMICVAHGLFWVYSTFSTPTYHH